MQSLLMAWWRITATGEEQVSGFVLKTSRCRRRSLGASWSSVGGGGGGNNNNDDDDERVSCEGGEGWEGGTRTSLHRLSELLRLPSKGDNVRPYFRCCGNLACAPPT